MKLLELQELIDEIKDVVYAPAMAEEVRLRELADRYDAACDEVNDRLRRCASLLQRGLRDEAIGLSEQKPNLLELVAILDFPESPEWRIVLNNSGLEVPSPIRIEIAEELNEAYSLQQPLNELLKKHRLLAMSFSPLPERLSVLRQIRELDPNNLAWNDDQADWEKARLRQISAEVNEAGQAGDEPRLLSVLRELQSSKWCVPPEPELIQRVSDMCRAIARQSAMTKLKELSNTLLSAHNDGDDTRCQSIYKELKNVSKSASVPFSDAVFAPVRHVLDWLSKGESQQELIKQQRALIQRLDQEIQAGQTIENLEFHFAALARLPLEVPGEVEQRYQQALRRLKRAKTRRSFAVAAYSVGAFAIVAAIAVGAFLFWQHNRRVGQAVVKLKEYLKHEDYEAAELFVEQLGEEHPAVLSSNRFGQILPEYEAKIRVEEQRRADFEARLAALQLRSIERLPIDKIGSLEKSAKTDRERRQIEDLRRRRSEVINDKFDAQLVSAEEQFRQLVSFEPVDGRMLRQLSDQLSNGDTQNFRSEASPDLQKKHSQLSDTIDRWIGKIQRDESFGREQDALTQHIGDPRAYRSALREFSKKYSDSDAAKTYERVANEEDLWTGVLAWSKLFEHEALRDTKKLSPSVAKELLSLGKQLQDEHAISQLSELFEAKEEYLAHIEARGIESDSGIESELKEMLSAPLMKELYAVNINYRDGGQYYVTQNPLFTQANEERIEFQYIAGFDGQTKERLVARKWLNVERAPHCVLADSIIRRIDDEDELHSAMWVPTFCDILKTIHENNSSEVILRVNFFKKALDVATRGSLAMTTAFAEHTKVLEREPIDVLVRWMLHDDAQANATRERAVKLFESLPSLERATNAAKAALEKEQKPVNVAFEWRGILHHAKGGTWRAVGFDSAALSGRIFVVHKTGSDGEAKISRIADVDKGQVEWSETDESILMEGRPLFFLASGR